MDSLKTLMEKKQFELVIQITETARDGNDIFYRIASFLGLSRPEEALHCLTVNSRLLEKTDLLLVMKMHIELLCLLQKYDLAYDAMEHYESLPYESQLVEEGLKEYRKYIRESERESYTSKDLSKEEILKRLDSDKSAVVIDGLQSIRQFDVELFLPKIERIMVNFPTQSIRSFALMVLVEKKVNKIFKFKHIDTIIEVNPSLLVPPFIDEKFQNFIRLIYSDFKNPALSQNAENIYSTYLIYIYPKVSEYNEAAILCALYGISLEFLQAGGEMSLEEKCSQKGVDIQEAYKIMDVLRNSIEILQ